MKKKDIATLSVELDGVYGLLEIIAIYADSALADVPACDTLNNENFVDAIRGLSSYIERISYDLAHMEGKQRNG